MPLAYRVAAMNAVLLVTAVVVTLLVLEPRKFSTVAVDEAVVLAVALALVAFVNLMVLRRVVRPLEALTALARRVDLAHQVNIADINAELKRCRCYQQTNLALFQFALGFQAQFA